MCRGLLAVETMHAIVQWLENLNIKRNMTSMFVNKKHRYWFSDRRIWIWPFCGKSRGLVRGGFVDLGPWTVDRGSAVNFGAYSVV